MSSKYKLAEWKGSLKTVDHVRAEIARRWGTEEAQKYNPRTNCFTLPTWNQKGYLVKEGEHGITSSTLITEQRETETGEVKQTTHYKTVKLFYILQVEQKQ